MASEQVCVYMTSVSSKQSISKQQRAILDFLDARGIDYLPIDMCANTNARPEMMEKIPEDQKADGVTFLPPQVFNGAEYCGDYDKFFDAREMDLLYSFFKLCPPEGSSEWKTANPEPEPVAEEIQEEIEEVEEVEEEAEVADDQLHGEQQPANEDTPMDAEGGEEKQALFDALKKESGDGDAEVEAPTAEEPEMESAAPAAEEVVVAEEEAAAPVEEEAAPAEAEEEATPEVTDEQNLEEVEYVEEAEEEPEEEEAKPVEPVEDTAEVDEYKSEDEA